MSAHIDEPTQKALDGPSPADLMAADTEVIESTEPTSESALAMGDAAVVEPPAEASAINQDTVAAEVPAGDDRRNLDDANAIPETAALSDSTLGRIVEEFSGTAGPILEDDEPASEIYLPPPAFSSESSTLEFADLPELPPEDEFPQFAAPVTDTNSINSPQVISSQPEPLFPTGQVLTPPGQRPSATAPSATVPPEPQLAIAPAIPLLPLEPPLISIPSIPIFEMGADQGSFLGGMPLQLDELPALPPTFGRVQVNFDDGEPPDASTLSSAGPASTAPGPYDRVKLDDLQPSEPRTALDNESGKELTPDEELARSKQMLRQVGMPAVPLTRPLRTPPKSPGAGPSRSRQSPFSVKGLVSDLEMPAGRAGAAFGAALPALSAGIQATDVFSHTFAQDPSTNPSRGSVAKRTAIGGSPRPRKPAGPIIPPIQQTANQERRSQEEAAPFGSHAKVQRQLMEPLASRVVALPQTLPTPPAIEPAPATRRHKIPLVALLAAMLICMALALAITWALVKRHVFTEGVLRYQNAGALTQDAWERFQQEQNNKFATDNLRAAADNIFRGRKPEESSGFLGDSAEFARIGGLQFQWLSDGERGRLRVAYEGDDILDQLRVQAVMDAMVDANIDLRVQAGKLQQDVEVNTRQLERSKRDLEALGTPQALGNSADASTTLPVTAPAGAPPKPDDQERNNVSNRELLEKQVETQERNLAQQRHALALIVYPVVQTEAKVISTRDARPLYAMVTAGAVAIIFCCIIFAMHTLNRTHLPAMPRDDQDDNQDSLAPERP